ncbi:MobC family plasmid mobilization relaxosome protein [Streptomyces griseoaurantiacus]|uniref:MobC family plasmid mobilization relaxosome protein n=1 Tax=Streptomyces griseoaurantiacus TaxID=68213 RepID=UPI001BC98CCD
MTGTGKSAPSDRPDADRPTATGGASYPVRRSYGPPLGPDSALGGGDEAVVRRTRAPDKPPPSRRDGAPAPGRGSEGPAVPPARSPRRRSRNTAPRQRRQKITIRLSVSERAEIAAAARVRGVTVARFLAGAGLAAARGDTAVEPHERRDALIDELAALRAQLARVGNNINQLARLANSGAVPHTDGLALALARLRRTTRRIDQTADTLVTRRSS